MDQILSCPACEHPIGMHTADGCGRVANAIRCTCTISPHGVIDAVLAAEAQRQAAYVLRPVTYAELRDR